MKQTIVTTAATSATGYGIYLFGNHTGIMPHEAAIAVAFAGAIAIAMYDDTKLDKKDFYIFSILSMLFAAIVSASIRAYFGLTDEHALTVSAIAGITSPFLFYDVKKRVPRLVGVLFTSLEGAIRRLFNKTGEK